MGSQRGKAFAGWMVAHEMTACGAKLPDEVTAERLNSNQTGDSVSAAKPCWMTAFARMTGDGVG